MKTGSQAHEARKGLFQVGLRRGHLTVSEIDEALPPGSLSPAERWLLFYSLRAAGVEIREERGQGTQDGDGRGDSVGVDPPSPS